MYRTITLWLNSLPSKFILLPLLLIPSITEYMENGRFPENARSVITDIIVTILIGVIILIIYRKNKLLEGLSMSDHLTGIGNRRQFDLDIKREILRSKRTNKNLCIVFFDLDGFKSINDKYGHKEGDIVLVKFAQCLSIFCRSGVDSCYRFGGDEFAVLLTDIGNNQFYDVARKIEDRLDRIVHENLPDGVSASKGLVFMNDNEDYEGLLKRADDAMYHAKRDKRPDINNT